MDICERDFELWKEGQFEISGKRTEDIGGFGGIGLLTNNVFLFSTV